LKALPAPAPEVFRRSHQAAQNGVQYQYPVCSVCNRDVESFAWSDHSAHADGSACRTFSVGCHGQIESMTIPLDAMKSATPGSFRIEYAFLAPTLDVVEVAPAPKLNRKRIAGALTAG
jgi:hypothetical protein